MMPVKQVVAFMLPLCTTHSPGPAVATATVAVVIAIVLGSALLLATVFLALWRYRGTARLNRQLEDELRRVSDRQKAMLAAVPDIVAEVNAEKVYTWMNEAGLNFFGEGAIGQEASRYFEGEQNTYQTVQPLFEGQENVIYIESWQRRKDGEKRLLAWWCRVLKDAQGRVTGALSTARDITDQKKAEEAVRRSEAELRSIFAAAPVGIGLVSNRILLKVNERIREMTGYAAHELVGQSARLLYPSQEDFEWVGQEKYRQIAERGTGTVETRWRCKDGRIIDVLLSSTPLDANDPSAGVTFTVLDITERKRTEQERECLVRELEGKNRELESLIYVASHDLRSPLVNILGFGAELEKACEKLIAALRSAEKAAPLRDALAPLLDEQIPDALRFIKASGAKMDALIGGLIRVSRTGRAALRIRPLDMNRILERVIATLQYQIQQTSATVEIGQLPPCEADPDQINQVFSNLLDNGLKYRDPQRPLALKVTGRVEAGEAVYCVEDTGRGIPLAHQERIWDLFHRLEPDSPTAGEGLGLTLVRRIVERHGGRVWVESSTGQGSRFYVALRAGPHYTTGPAAYPSAEPTA